MISRFSKKHSIDTFAALLLFALYVLFLLFLLLFAAGNYRISVENQSTNQNLYTAVSYITTKFRQHDQPQGISLEQVQDIPALCFHETINETPYTTYIYFHENQLKELFTAEDSLADLSMGTPLAQLSSFQVEWIEQQFYQITLTDETGHSSCFLLHPGVSAS